MATGTPHGITTGAGAPRGPGDDAGSAPRRPGGGWTAGRVISLVIGSLLALVSLGLLGGGGTLMWADQSLRQDGFVTTGTATYSTTGYALASERVNLGWGWLLSGVVGDVRLRATAVGAGSPVFVAIGPAGRVSAYLSGTTYATVTGAGADALVSHVGTVRPGPPRTAGIWVAQAAGTGTQALRWTAERGNWMAVVMNPGGTPGLSVRADAGVSAPWLFRLAVELIVGGILAGALSAALIVVPARLASGAQQP
jgi:hypothetical protein